MAGKPSPILEKRIQELESYLNDIKSLPSDTPPHLYLKDFHQLLTFFRNLLSAEIASSPENPPVHLERIQRRLSEIELSFTKLCVPDHQPVLTCLCEETDEEVVAGKVNYGEKGDVAAEKRGGGFCRGFGVGVVVGMVVMGFVMAGVLGCFSYMQRRYPVCLAPT